MHTKIRACFYVHIDVRIYTHTKIAYVFIYYMLYTYVCMHDICSSRLFAHSVSYQALLCRYPTWKHCAHVCSLSLSLSLSHTHSHTHTHTHNTTHRSGLSAQSGSFSSHRSEMVSSSSEDASSREYMYMVLCTCMSNVSSSLECMYMVVFMICAFKCVH